MAADLALGERGALSGLVVQNRLSRGCALPPVDLLDDSNQTGYLRLTRARSTDSLQSMNAAKWLLGLCLAIPVLWIGPAWYLAERIMALGDSPYDETAELEILRELGISDLTRTPVEILSGEILLAGSWFTRAEPSQCAVIMLPGVGGNRTQVLPALPIFWELGCHVLAYDPRGTGASSRVPRTFGYVEKQDNVAAIRWIEQQTGIKAHAVGVWGPSFGGSVAIMTLDELDPLSFVIADSPFQSLQQVTHDVVAFVTTPALASLLIPAVSRILEIRAGVAFDEVRPELSIAAKSTPVLLIHALDDPALPVAHSAAIHQAGSASTDVELQITDWGAGHADSALIDPQAYGALIYAFLAGRESTIHLVNDL